MSYGAPPYGEIGYPAPQRSPALMQPMRAMGSIGPKISQQPNPKESAAKTEEATWYEMELEEDVFSVALVAMFSQRDDLSGVLYVPGVWCV